MRISAGSSDWCSSYLGAPSSRHANADGHLRRTHRYLPGRVVNERGSVTAFVVIMTSALLAMAGLVIDGGYALAAHRRAFNEAEAAARAGAQAVDLDTLRATEIGRAHV